MFRSVMACVLCCLMGFAGCATVRFTDEELAELAAVNNLAISEVQSVANSIIQEDVELLRFSTDEWESLYGSDVGRTGLKGPAVVRAKNKEFTIVPRDETFERGAVVYNFIPDTYVQVFTCPLHLTVFSLRPGERLIGSPSAGDTYHFRVELQYSLDSSGRRIQHVLIKPTVAGKSTTMFLATNQRTYIFRLYSYERTFMPSVRFRYPIDVAREFSDSYNANSAPIINADLAELDFNYEIVNPNSRNIVWEPREVFSTATKTYIQFRSPVGASVTPIVFGVDNGQRVIVNYRLRGGWYEIDQVLDEMILFASEKEYIVIKRKRGSGR